MSTKHIIISLVAVIIIGGAVYVAISGKASTRDTTLPPLQTSIQETPSMSTVSAVSEPAKNAPTSDIIDYLVDGQAHNETVKAQAIIDTPSAQATQDTTISTNF